MKNPPNRKLGPLLLEERERRGWNQRTAADYFNVSNPTISSWERGESIPSFDKQMLERMTDFLGLDSGEMAILIVRSIVEWQERRSRS
jgi:transcriptional regulator with XRE-family HTH domain